MRWTLSVVVVINSPRNENHMPPPEHSFKGTESVSAVTQVQTTSPASRWMKKGWLAGKWSMGMCWQQLVSAQVCSHSCKTSIRISSPPCVDDVRRIFAVFQLQHVVDVCD